MEGKKNVVIFIVTLVYGGLGILLIIFRFDITIQGILSDSYRCASMYGQIYSDLLNPHIGPLAPYIVCEK